MCHRDEGSQIIAVCRSIHRAPRRIQPGVEAAAKSEIISHGFEDALRGEPLIRRALAQHVDVVGELVDLCCGAIVAETARQRTHSTDAALLADPFDDSGRESARRPARRVRQRAAWQCVPRRDSQLEPRQRARDARAFEESAAQWRISRHAHVAQHDLRHEQRAIDPRQHRNIAGRDAVVNQSRHCLSKRSSGFRPGLDNGCPRAPHVAVRRGRTDLLVDASLVVRQQVAGSVDHRRRAAVVHVQVMARRSGEVRVEVDEPLRRCACVAVDGLVVVADCEDIGSGARQQPDHQQVGRGQVLELVHEHHTADSACGGTGCRVGQEDLDCPDDLLVEIDHAVRRQILDESRRDGCKVGHIGLEIALHLSGIAQAQPGNAECLEPGRELVGHRAPATLDQAVKAATHPHLVDHVDATMLGWARKGSRTVADGERQAVQGANFNARKIRSALLHLAPGTHVECHETHGARCNPDIAYQVAGTLGEHARLARARGRHDAGRSPEVTDRCVLVGREVRLRTWIPDSRQAADGQIRSGHDRQSEFDRAGIEGAERSAVTPHRPRIGDHVSRARTVVYCRTRNQVGRRQVASIQLACAHVSRTRPDSSCGAEPQRRLDGREARPAGVSGIHGIGGEQVRQHLRSQRRARFQFPPRCMPDRRRVG